MRAFILFSLTIFLILGITLQENTQTLNNNTANNPSLQYCETFIYERVLINGVWWIYVYTQDGTLVDIYPDYEN